MSGDTEIPPPSGRRSAPVKRSRRRPLVIAAIVAVLALSGGSLAFTSSEASARSQFDTVVSAFEAEKSAVADTADAAASLRDDAQSALDDSAGRVLVEDSRVALAAAIDSATTRIDGVEESVQAADDAVSVATAADDGSLAPGAGLREAASSLEEFDFPETDDLEDLAASFEEPLRAVAEAVAAWQAELDRILASRYTNHVHAVGWTSELDECVGSVDISAHYDNVPTIAEHWSCGGRAFPDEAGTIIRLTGENEGTYRVDGIVKMVNQHIATVADVPRGYDLLYQTCQNGQSTTMSFTALTRLD